MLSEIQVRGRDILIELATQAGIIEVCPPVGP